MLIGRLEAVLVLLLVGCGSGVTGGGTPDAGEPDGAMPDGGMPPEAPLVVDSDWLEAHLGDPDVQLIDTRASGYAASRIPGAIRLRPGDLATTVDGVPSQVAPPTEAQPVLRAAGRAAAGAAAWPSRRTGSDTSFTRTSRMIRSPVVA